MDNEILKTTTENDTLLMQYISKSLLDLGMKPNLKGFNYVKEAIILYPEIIRTNKRFNYIYSVIAENYGTSLKNAERSIRTSINILWCSEALNLNHCLFNYSYIDMDYPPSNTVFIATMAEMIKLSIGKSRLTGNVMPL